MLRTDLLHFSQTIGTDPLLVQGAGGNISWKDGSTLWIKASGTWLAEAMDRAIFVPMDLAQTRALLAAGAADLSPAVKEGATLRPSIETSLHTLLPHAIVVHVHAIEVLALSVLKAGRAVLADKLRGLNWLWVDYTKPGAPLAEAIAAAMRGRSAPDILVLGNHGLIVGGDDLSQLQDRLDEVLRRCHQTPRDLPQATAPEAWAAPWQANGYVLPEDGRVHALALDATCLALARHHWVMYPDHAVFLGAEAVFIGPDAVIPPELPVCLLLQGHGVLVRADMNPGQAAMLSCYLEVASRIAEAAQVQSLTPAQIAELLHWDAEKYRQRLNEKKA